MLGLRSDRKQASRPNYNSAREWSTYFCHWLSVNLESCAVAVYGDEKSKMVQKFKEH
jgi:hypothetical protein